MKYKNIILVTGASGQLAKSVLEVFPKKNLYLFTKDELDVTDKDQLRKIVVKYHPQIIFHFASLTRGDDCAKNPKLAHKINVEGTRNIVDICKKFDITLVFVSTNEVFDGKNNRPYSEKDIPKPITVAGKTKLKAEKIIISNLNKYFIIRTSWLYSKWSRNFLHVIFGKITESKNLKLVDDEISSPTYSVDLAAAIKKLIKSNKYGLYHLVNEGMSSRLEFAKKAFEISGKTDINIIPVKLRDFKRLSKPPLFSPLESTKARKLGIKLPKWESGLKRFLKENNL